MAAVHRQGLAVLSAIGAISLLVVLFYTESFASMVRLWSYSDYSHGVVVFPITAYLLWRLRGELAAVQLESWPWGVAIVIAFGFGWILSRNAGVQAGEHLAIVLLIPATVAACLGPALVRQALFPFMFLLMAVPVGDTLIPHLMRLTADISAGLLQLTGVPVFRNEQLMMLPGGTFEVAEVCSGLRYLSAGTTLSLLFAYLNYRTNWKRAAFVAATALALVGVNGVRAFVVMYVASATEMRIFAGRDHVYFGWVLFAVVVGAVFWIGSRYSDKRPPASVGASRSTQHAPATQVLPAVLVLGLVMLALTAQAHIASIWLLLVPTCALLLLWMASTALPTGLENGSVPVRRLRAGNTLIVLLVAGAPALVSALSAVVASMGYFGTER